MRFEKIKHAFALFFVASLVLSFMPVKATSASTEESAVDLAQSWLRGKGWAEGWDRDDGRFVTTTMASFPSDPSRPDFIDRRQNAFATAFSEARARIAEFLSAAIETELESKRSLVEVVGDPELAEILVGASESEAYLARDSFRELVRVAANATLVGSTPVQTFVTSDGDRSQVAMVVAWGPRYAAAVRGRMEDVVSTGPGLDAWFSAQSDASLASTFGHRFVRDERGALRPVSFGVSRLRAGMEDRGFDQAEIIADGLLGGLQGERLASEEAMSSASNSLEGTAIPSRFVSRSDFMSEVGARSSIEGLGLQTVGRRTITDPLSGGKLAVVARTVVFDEPDSMIDSGNASRPANDQEDGSSGTGGCPEVEERMRPFIRQVRSSGLGKTREEAVSKALYEAIQTEGVRIEGDSRLSKRFSEAMESVGEEIREKASSSTEMETNVDTHADGFVHSFGVLGESAGGELVEVDICANLVRFDPKNPRFGLPPTVAVLPWGTGERGVRIDGRRESPDVYTDDSEEFLERILSLSGRFQVLDERNDAQLDEVRDRIRSRADQGRVPQLELIKLGRALTADYVLTGEIDRIEVVEQTAKDIASRRVEVVLDARLVGVAEGTVVWSDSARGSLRGRDLMLVRRGEQPNGEDVLDPEEERMSPDDLGLLWALRKLGDSLGEHLETLSDPSDAAEPATAPIVLRISLGKVTFEAAAGTKVGDRFAVENPIEVILANGQVLEDVDQVAIVKVVSMRTPPLAKAEVIEGDPDLIEANRSRLVSMVPE